MTRPRAAIGDGQRTAARLEEQNPCWMIIFGSYTREYVAFPLFGAPGCFVAATEARELARHMRHIEITYALAHNPALSLSRPVAGQAQLPPVTRHIV